MTPESGRAHATARPAGGHRPAGVATAPAGPGSTGRRGRHRFWPAPAPSATRHRAKAASQAGEAPWMAGATGMGTTDGDCLAHRPGAKAPSAAPTRQWPAAPGRSGEAGQGLAHLLHRGHLDLADALGAHAVLGGQLVQRLATRTIVVDLEPALGHDAARALVQLTQRPGDA